jgi:hypothetical protein
MKPLWAGIGLVIWEICAVGLPVHSAQEEQQQQIEMLIEAVHQSRRPSRDMRIKWAYESVEPSIIYFGMSDQKIPDQAPATSIDYTATISGARSRIESLQKTYNSGDKTAEPYDIRQSTAVFNGKIQRKLTDRLKGARTTPLGWQYFEDKNSIVLLTNLYNWPFDLCDPEQRKHYTLELVDGSDPNIYFIDAIDKDGWRERFTIDASKQFNITKIECIRLDGSYDWVNNYTLRQNPSGIWYIDGWERTRWPPVGAKEKLRVEYKAKITSAEFNIDVPDNAFVLDFPHGTKVWDNILRDWFVVGDPGQLTIEQEPLDVPRQKKSAKDEETIESPKQQELPAHAAEAETLEAQTDRAKTPSGTLAETSRRNTLLWCLLVVPVIILIFIFFRAMKLQNK